MHALRYQEPSMLRTPRRLCFVWFSATVQRRRLCLCDYCRKRLMRHGNTYIDGTSLGWGEVGHTQSFKMTLFPAFLILPSRPIRSFFFFFFLSAKSRARFMQQLNPLLPNVHLFTFFFSFSVRLHKKLFHTRLDLQRSGLCRCSCQV